MLDLDPRFLGAVPTPGVLNISRPFYTVSWSQDNQVALITDGGGIFVVDFVHTHEEVQSQTLRFIGNETRIAGVRSNKDQKDLESYTGISLTSLLRSKDKNEIFEIVRDPIMCPKELVSAEVHFYFTKVSWSERPLKMTPKNEGKFQYILAALDSHFNLRLYIKSPGPGEMENNEGLLEQDDWKVCVDFTESYRQLLISQFWSINVVDEDSFNSSLFNEYKRRMYEVGTVDFLWLPPWNDSTQKIYKQSSEGEYQTSLVTAHASGDICIWNVCINYATGHHEIDQDTDKYEPNFYLTLEFRRNLIPGEIVSSLNFFKMSSSLGLLVVGTVQGSVRVFRIAYNSVALGALKPLPDDEQGDIQPQKYTVDNGVVLCEPDQIEVQTTCGVICKNEGEVDRLQLFVFRHPNFMITYELSVPEGEGENVVIEQSQPPLRIVQGILTGALLISKEGSEEIILMNLTQRGILSWMHIEHGQVKEVSSSDLGFLEESGGGGGGAANKELGGGGMGIAKKRLQFGGLAVSPNKAMICVSKTLAEYYNHLALRTPSVLQFHSMIPNKTAWNYVYEKCIENRFLFHRMTDVLSAFRVLMISSSDYFKEILDWAVPLDSKSINDLQILFWVLRVQPHVDRDQLSFAYTLRKETPQPFLDLKSQQVRGIRRETLVSDKIIQLRCWDMIKKVVENPVKYELNGNEANLQSLMIMYDYLKTKPRLLQKKGGGKLPLKPRVLVDPPPRKPACPLCSKPTKQLSVPPPERWKVGQDYFEEHPFDKEYLEGVLWHEQTHVQKTRTHPITNCVLSLVPTSFPYRKCGLCGTICLLYPAFKEEPLCPFCNGIMEAPLGYQEEDTQEEDPLQTEERDNEELQRLIQDIKDQQEVEVRRRVETAPISRRARIENMYIDS